MDRVKVAVVVGHRSKRQGAIGSAGISEWLYNKKLAKEIKEYFKDSELVELKIFYRDNMPGGYSKRMERLHMRIDEWGADYSISLHFNASANKRVDGHEVLYCSSFGELVARELNSSFNRHLANRDRGIKKVTKKDRGGGFVCRGKSVCVLAEPFFGAHQGKYMPGSSGYKALKGAYMEFIKTLGEMGGVRNV